MTGIVIFPASHDEFLLTVTQALERAGGPVEAAEDVRWTAVGIEDSDDIPTAEEIRSALQLLAYPSIGVVTQDVDGHRVTTDYENGIQLVRSLWNIVQSRVAADDS